MWLDRGVLQRDREGMVTVRKSARFDEFVFSHQGDRFVGYLIVHPRMGRFGDPGDWIENLQLAGTLQRRDQGPDPD